MPGKWGKRGRPRNVAKPPKGFSRMVGDGKQTYSEGASHGEHSNARRERLRRIASGGKG